MAIYVSSFVFIAFFFFFFLHYSSLSVILNTLLADFNRSASEKQFIQLIFPHIKHVTHLSHTVRVMVGSAHAWMSQLKPNQSLVLPAQN